MSELVPMSTLTMKDEGGSDVQYEVIDKKAREATEALGKEEKVAEHNINKTAHTDIRLLLAELIAQVNNFLNVDDTTRDQLSELLRDIDANKTSIEAITTSKVSVADIVNDLTTNVTNRTLSAAQGVALKGLYDALDAAVKAIKVPTQLSELTGDATHRTVTDSEKQTWNNKQPAGDYANAEHEHSQYLTEHQDLSQYAKKLDIPTSLPASDVKDWAKASNKPTYTASEVGADASGTAANKVSDHNTSTAAHNDIRLLIESVTTNKVNVSDIIDNLTTSASNKPLAASQGVALKKLIDTLQTAVNNIKVPSKTSELTNDSGFLTQHQSLSGYAKTADHYTKTESDNKYQPKGSYLTAVPSEYVTETELAGKGYAKQTEVSQLSEEIADLTLGLHTDGLVYLFNGGVPQGTGIAMIGGETGDVIGNVDSANNVVLYGNLPVGEYTVKYEMEDGSLMNVGTLTVASGGTTEPDEPVETNYFDISTASLNKRIGSSGSLSDRNGIVTTDFIPVDSSMAGKRFNITGVTLIEGATYKYQVRLAFYNESKALITSTFTEYKASDGGFDGTVIAWDNDITSTNAYIRISLQLKDNVALTNDDVANLKITL